MSKTAHTPGPWMVLPETNTGREGQFCILTENGPRLDIASTYGWPDTPKEANARLIAAAPDMLTLLKEIAQTVTMHGKFDYGTPLYDRTCDTITKAEGQS